MLKKQPCSPHRPATRLTPYAEAHDEAVWGTLMDLLGGTAPDDAEHARAIAVLGRLDWRARSPVGRSVGSSGVLGRMGRLTARFARQTAGLGRALCAMFG